MCLDCAGSEKDAIRWGEHEAEKLAEACREGDAQFQADIQIDEARDVIHAINIKALALIRAIKSSDKIFAEPICQALRENLHGYLSDRCNQFKRIAALQNNFWLSVERG